MQYKRIIIYVLLLLSFSFLMACGGTNTISDTPVAPTNISVIPSESSITLTWQHNGRGELGFIIFREELDAAGLRIQALSKYDEVAAGINQFTDENVSLGKIYRYAVVTKIASRQGEKPEVLGKTEV